MFRSKRGMSPLIATILLIAFAVSIGAVIMSYGNAYYTDDGIITKNLCQDIDIYEVGGVKRICMDGDNLNFVLLNKGPKTIEDVHVLASFEGEKTKVDMLNIKDSKIIPGQPYNGEIKIDTSNGELVQVQFLFKIYGQHNCFLDPVTEISDC